MTSMHITNAQYAQIHEQAEQKLDKLDPCLFYHSKNHSLTDVTPQARQLALLEGFEASRQNLVGATAVCHDLGFLIKYAKNEVIGATYFAQFARNANVSPDEIVTGRHAILSTDITRDPLNDEGAMLTDADLSSLGRRCYLKSADLLRIEAMQFPTHPMYQTAQSDVAWYTMQAEFLANHKWHTKSAKKMYQQKLEQNLKRIEKLIKGADDSCSITTPYLM